VARIFNTFGPRMHPNDGRVVSNFIIQVSLLLLLWHPRWRARNNSSPAHGVVGAPSILRAVHAEALKP
jgi:nucleoside-diphosphate-sugar epimerase